VRRTIKRAFFIGALCCAAPLVALYRIAAVVIGEEPAFQCGSHFVALFPGVPGDYLRLGYYALTLRRCSHECRVSFGTIFSTPNCEIGRYVYIGAYCVISDSVIEDDALIGSHVHVISGKNVHNYSSIDLPIRLQSGTRVPVRIGRGTWIGDGAMVMADIGCECVIGAGSVVTRKVAELSIAAGNPARVIRLRTDFAKGPRG
jgi:acetyltransferase-like isoleucine patch superfamily enzyme